jgi:molecular chaperone HtpG
VAGGADTHAFQADVSRLLHLMVHSIYSDRDIFLRELISNAADACEKLRYQALSDPALVADGAAGVITVTIDKPAKTLTISDNGVGMDHDDLVQALGTIANSGTRAFLEQLAPGGEPGEDREVEGGAGGAAKLIGQFGIGFYSAFIVAEKVVVETRRAGAGEAWSWTSDGRGAYTIAPLDLEDAPLRGTRVILHLNEQSADYLESWRLQGIIKEHSGAVATPVDLKDEPTAEARRIVDGAALWSKPKSEIAEADYTEFYRGLAGQFDEPAMTVHWRAEGRHEYTVLAFVPGSRPLDLFDPDRKARGKLYVRSVLISTDSDLLPGWLRFFRLVVDSADLPLNVSREMVQQSPVFASIRKAIVNRLVQELGKKAEGDPEGFAKIWENFGALIKEGLYEEPDRRDALFKFIRFASSKHPDGGRTLADYVKDLRPNQTAIYYLTGENAKHLASSPQLEGFAARGVEVLLLPDPVDAFWVSSAVGFDGKPFKSVTQGAADIKSIPVAEGNEAPTAEASAEVATLIAFIKQTIGDAIEDARASDRLSASAACLVASDKGPDRRLEQLLAQHGQLGKATKPILEINPTHPLVVALAAKLKGGDEKPLIEDAAWLIHDEARLMDGEKLPDVAAFSARLTRVLQAAAG